MMTWEDFKLKFSRYHVPPGLIKKMRDEFRELKQGRMSVVEYRDRFLTLSRSPDETDTNEKKKERFLNGLHDEMQTVLVNIQFVDLEALVDSAIQMEGKLNQANENRKRRMMNQSGPSNTSKYRPNSSGGFASRLNKPPVPMSRPNFPNRSGGHPRPGGNNNNNNNQHNSKNNTTNTAPRTGSNVVPIAPKDKSTVTCYECGVTGHYSNECPKKLTKAAPNTAAPAQQQCRVLTGRNPNNRNGRFYRMNATEAQEAPNVVLEPLLLGDHDNAIPMPLTMTSSMPLSSPLFPGSTHHVLETVLTHLITLVQALGQLELGIAQARTCPHHPGVPRPAWSRRQGAQGRRDAPANLALALPSAPTRRLALTPGTSQTSSLSLPCHVAVTVIDDVRHSTARHEHDAASPDLHFLCHEACPTRHDARNNTPSSPCPFAAQSATSMTDCRDPLRSPPSL
ncbi:hypothetical protein QYE76_008447 [Lolium multiflorum]|uniref:CCHC-type domain-containing protein n=1 Tax=Lolium multiflorum TaxID=4521 RepID=A0AAD8TQ53_LOLMU|nr:hypothetical protein QYE76_008447 [Lolium multiflorum]